jgi:hypothetical protein
VRADDRPSQQIIQIGAKQTEEEYGFTKESVQKCTPPSDVVEDADLDF